MPFGAGPDGRGWEEGGGRRQCCADGGPIKMSPGTCRPCRRPVKQRAAVLSSGLDGSGPAVCTRCLKA